MFPKVNDDKQCSGEWHFVFTNSLTLTYIFDTNRMLIISSRAIIPSRSINRSTMDNTITSGRELIVINL